MQAYLAITTVDVADFIHLAVNIYTGLILLYILTELLYSFEVRIPYNAFTDALIKGIRAACEPYLELFRRFIPPLGPIDISPIVAVLVLQFVSGLLIRALI